MIKDVRLRRSASPQEATISPLMPFKHSSIPQNLKAVNIAGCKRKAKGDRYFRSQWQGLISGVESMLKRKITSPERLLRSSKIHKSLTEKFKTINRKVSFGKRLGKPSRFKLGAGFKISSLFASQNYLPQVI